MTEQNLLDKINELEQKLLDSYDLKPVVYIGYTEKDKSICKFGYTNDIKIRLEAHRSQIGKYFKPEYILETVYNREVEKDIKLNLSHRIVSKVYGTKIQKELILLDNEFDIKQLYDLIVQYKDSYNDKNIIIKLTNELEKLMNEKEDIEYAIDEKKQTIKKLKGKIYKCSGCKYTSDYKSNVVKHITKDKRCSINKLEINEIETNILCDFCSKTFTNSNSRNRHMKICKFLTVKA